METTQEKTQLTERDRELLTMIKESKNPEKTLNVLLIVVLILVKIKDNLTLSETIKELHKVDEKAHQAFVDLLAGFASNGDTDGGVKAGIEFLNKFTNGEAVII